MRRYFASRGGGEMPVWPSMTRSGVFCALAYASESNHYFDSRQSGQMDAGQAGRPLEEANG